MALPFPVDPGSNSNPNPYFQDNAFVRGDQQRSFSAQAWANMLNLDARLDVVEGDIVTIDGHLTTIDAEIATLQIATLATGLNTGGVVLNSTSLPPSILPGTYDISGTRVGITAQTALSLTTDVFKKSRQALDISQVYHVCMNNAGAFAWLLAMGPAVGGHTGNITSITQFSGTGTLTAATGTISGDTGNILVISGTTQFDGVYLIASNAGAGVCTFKTSGNVNTGAVGTYAIYSALSVNSNANMALTLNPAKNGYYLDANGVNGSSATTWRVLGRWFTDGAAATQYVVPFGNGDEQGRQYLTPVVNQGVNVITAAVTPPTKGTTSVDEYSTQIRGGMLRMWGSYRHNGGSPADGSGAYYLSPPATLGNIDTSTTANNSGGAEGRCGEFSGYNSGNNVFVGDCLIYDGSANQIWVIFYIAVGAISSATAWGSTALSFNQSPLSFAYEIEVPLVGYL